MKVNWAEEIHMDVMFGSEMTEKCYWEIVEILLVECFEHLEAQGR